MITRLLAALGLLFFLCGAAFGASVKVPYSGRLAQNGTLVNGNAQFKFVLINPSNGQSLWSNDNTSTNGSQPTTAVSITVSNGLYSVLLGDTAVTNMTALDSSVFAATGLKLRVFVNGEQLTPDVELGSSPYAANADRLNGLDSSALLQLSGGTMTGTLTVNGNVNLGTDGTNNTIILGNNSGDTLTFNGAITGASPFILEGATVNANKLTLSLADPTAPRAILFPDASGTIALTSNNLSAFSPTTSSQLAGVISDETGSGSLVFATSPTLSAPVISGGATIDAPGNSPLLISADTTASNGFVNSLALRRTTAVTASSGIGIGMTFQIENAAGNTIEAGRVVTTLSNPTAGAEQGILAFHVRNSGSITVPLTVDSTGATLLGDLRFGFSGDFIRLTNNVFTFGTGSVGLKVDNTTSNPTLSSAFPGAGVAVNGSLTVTGFIFPNSISANGTLSLDNGTTTISSAELNVLDGGITAPYVLTAFLPGTASTAGGPQGNGTFFSYNPSIATAISVAQLSCFAQSATTSSTVVRISNGTATADCTMGAAASTCTSTGAPLLTINVSDTVTLKVQSTSGTPAANLTCTIEGSVAAQ